MSAGPGEGGLSPAALAWLPVMGGGRLPLLHQQPLASGLAHEASWRPSEFTASCHEKTAFRSSRPSLPSCLPQQQQPQPAGCLEQAELQG